MPSYERVDRISEEIRREVDSDGNSRYFIQT